MSADLTKFVDEMTEYHRTHGFRAAILEAFGTGDKNGFVRGRKSAADDLWVLAGEIKTNG